MAKTLDLGELISLTARDYGFLTHCGEDGRRWLAELQEQETLDILNDLTIALAAMRRHELKESFELLAAIEQAIRARAARRPDGLPSVTRLLGRYRVSVLAYCNYLDGDLELAKAHLVKAHEEVKVIIGMNEFLIPMAIQCTDFLVQRARVARRESQWKEAEGYIAKVHDVFAGIRPLCVLESGRPIGLPEIREFFAGLPLDDEQRAQAHKLMGDNIPLPERIEYLEEMIFALPDVVIPYP